ncbi:PREDICTED: uncharacterized protein LOC104777856 [Camelina sativa]|uniref:Uncharacterized protein LOC104777856 n=1 Tax=Camelina sativa TaxID=90675 RepID=A0ABM1RFM8_CAMSA|nr:PREDICTED: uncharacterized protein LOC104777856 [Camelina sativa]
MTASGKLAEANPCTSLQAPTDPGDDVQCLGDRPANKRKARCDTTTSSEARRSRTDSTVAVVPPSNGSMINPDASWVAEELKSKILAHDFESLANVGIAPTVDEAFFDLLKAMSSLHLVEKKLSSEHQINERLKRELSNEKSKTALAHETIAFKNRDIATLEAKLVERDHATTDLKADN